MGRRNFGAQNGKIQIGPVRAGMCDPDNCESWWPSKQNGYFSSGAVRQGIFMRLRTQNQIMVQLVIQPGREALARHLVALLAISRRIVVAEFAA